MIAPRTMPPADARQERRILPDALRWTVHLPALAPHERPARNRRARSRHARLAPPHPRPPRDGVRGGRHQRVRRRQAARVRARRAHRARQDRCRRRAAPRLVEPRRGTARGPRRAAHPREVRRAARVAARRQDARVRPRRAHDDAARRGAGDGAAEELRRHRLLHLPAGGGERRRRPRDGAGGPLRPLSDAGGVRHAQLAGVARGQDRAARRSA